MDVIEGLGLGRIMEGGFTGVVVGVGVWWRGGVEVVGGGPLRFGSFPS